MVTYNISDFDGYSNTPTCPKCKCGEADNEPGYCREPLRFRMDLKGEFRVLWQCEHDNCDHVWWQDYLEVRTDG